MISDLDDLYETSLCKNLDSTYRIAETPISSKEFIRNIKNLILGIPNALYDIESKKNRGYYRLKSISHMVAHNFIQEIIHASESYQFLNQLIETLKKKNELISPAFARGLKQILGFFENYIITTNDDLTFIQFSIQTHAIRSQINSLTIVCTNLPGGLKLIDYLYNIIIRNEGDFENYHLLLMLFKHIIKPILNTLTDFLFNCEINDIYGEFFICYNKEIGISIDYSLEKYQNSYKAIPSLLFDSISSDLVALGKNMRILKFLEEDLSCYYQLVSTSTYSSMEIGKAQVPYFKISYNTEEIEQISDVFIEFYAEQTYRLLELEQKEIEFEQNSIRLMQEKKKQSMQNLKLVSIQKFKIEQEKSNEKRRKQWDFYQNLENQLKGNKELKRIEEEKKRKDEIRAQEKYEQEQRELVEKGKKYLMDRHQSMIAELNSKKAIET